WWSVLHPGPPRPVTLQQAVDALGEATSGPSTSVVAGATGAATSLAGSDGTWRVDTCTGSFARFLINERLSRIGAGTAVGTSATVSGTLGVSGTRVQSGQITVDLRAITTNDSRRDDRVQSALSTSRFPNATFALTQPLEVGRVPADGEAVTVPATGDLTIRGVTRRVTIDLEAALAGDILVVVGSTVITFADYGIAVPSAPIVLSVDDHGTVEFQLYLRRA
ncbi:MAG: YceI family protein, partial [Acidimicrobiales bacterium]